MTNKEATVKNEPTTNAIASSVVPTTSTNQPTAQLTNKESTNGRLFRSSRKISNESCSVTPKTEPVETPGLILTYTKYAVALYYYI